MARRSLPDSIRDLQTAADLSVGRVPDEAVAEARRVCAQADRRLTLAGDATVVALAGATGSGKSSLFNALSGTTLARAGVRRPTTSRALAATWTEDRSGIDDLLDWLQVPERHTVVGGEAKLGGLVLLDLPDHDSTELDHRMEVDRLVKLVDVFCWVVDPQKYADAALHDNYLKPLAPHAAGMVVVLNQVDQLSDADRARCLKDLRQLLDTEGLADARLVAVSALTGAGISELTQLLAKVIKEKKAAAQRLTADVQDAARRLAEATGDAPEPTIGDRTVARLSGELAEAAGLEAVTEAVRGAWRKRGAVATGWPVVSWISGLRPDPLRRLHLDKLPKIRSARTKELAPVDQQRTSLPVLGGVGRARVDAAVRELADEGSRGLPRGWADAVRDAAHRDDRHLPDDVDRAIGGADLGMRSGNGWWWIVRVLQWLLIAVMVVGLGWLGLDWALRYFRFPPLPMYEWHRLPLPTWLAMGGAAAGVVLALISRALVEWGAAVKAKAAERAVRRSVAAVCERHVVEPVEAELDRRRQVREALARIG